MSTLGECLFWALMAAILVLGIVGFFCAMHDQRKPACTHEVLGASALIAMRCEDCGLLRPYEPPPTPEWLLGKEIVLGERGAYARPKS